MALGGGSFTTQNKVLPGTYINFVSAAASTPELSERGIATMPLELDWGKEGSVFTVSSEEFQKNSMELFGYAYEHEKMKGLRELFRGASTLHAYRLNGGGAKASNDYATARYSGTRGNDIRIAVQENADNTSMFDVITYLEGIKLDTQTVAKADELKSNDYVDFKSEAVLAKTVAKSLTGGTNGTVDGKSYQNYADRIESYTFNTMGVVTTDETVKNMFVSFVKRMRDEIGIKFQLVLYQSPADYMGVINVKNKTEEEGWPESALVYWVTGAECGCMVNKSCQNKKYDGEFSVNTVYTQSELQNAIKAGEFVLHNVNSDIRVLEDINSMVTTTEECGDIFKDNQTIRVIDQLGNEDAVLFNTKYLGTVPNNDSGRISLWSDLVKIRQQLQDVGAIENFTDSDVEVTQGNTKKSVVVTGTVQVAGTMSKVYMTITVQ